MRLSLTLLAALLAALSAGCIGAPGKTMTAREGLDDARSAAEGWAEGRDLGLLGIVAVEPFKHIQSTDEATGEVDAEFVTHLDGNPGDGKAPGWVYGFFDGERCIVVMLAAGLGVLAEGYETCSEPFDGLEEDAGEDAGARSSRGEDDDPEVVGDWAFDSNEVAQILGAEEQWPDLGEDGTYLWGLFPDEGKTVWVVGGIGEDGETVEAVVDATTGEVVEIEHVPADAMDGFLSDDVPAGSDGGPGASVSRTDQDSDSSPALVAGGMLLAEVDLEDVGRIDLHVSANAIVGGFVLAIDGPDGRVAEDDLGGVATGYSMLGRTYEDLPAGHYTVTLTAQGTALLADLRVDASW